MRYTASRSPSSSRIFRTVRKEMRALALMSSEWRQQYEKRQRRLAESAPSTIMTPELFAKFMDFERMFVEAGGRLVMGPDPGRHVLPGCANRRGINCSSRPGLRSPKHCRSRRPKAATRWEWAIRLGESRKATRRISSFLTAASLLIHRRSGMSRSYSRTASVSIPRCS